jgi:hypothetical protein
MYKRVRAIAVLAFFILKHASKNYALSVRGLRVFEKIENLSKWNSSKEINSLLLFFV